MQIPVGDFGQAIARPGPMPSIPQGNPIGDAAAGVARVGQGIAADMQELEHARQSNAALDSTLDYELKSKTAAAELARQLQTGEVQPDDAPGAWEKVQSMLRTDTIDSIPAPFREGAQRRAARVDFSAGAEITRAVDVAHQQQFGADAFATLDRFGKLAALPDADIDGIFRNADLVFPRLAQRAGIPEAAASQRLQSWKDSTRFARAQIDLSDVRRDPEGLAEFSKRLDEGGDYYGNLDPAKVVMLRRDADSYRWQMEQSAIRASDRRDSLAERAVTGTTRQIETGIPLTADGWNTLRRAVLGTPSEGAFSDLLQHEAEVQSVFRMPLDQQEAYVQQRESALMQTGGTLVDKANLQRIRQAVETNTKQLADAPLLAAKRLYGTDIEMLDLTQLVQPGGMQHGADVLNSRAATLQAMQKQYGDRVGMKPLLPQEASALVKAIDVAPISQVADLFSNLRMSMQDDATFAGAMQQVAADAPVKARAAMLASMRVGVTLESNVIRDDVQTSSRKVAETLLQGEAILDKTRGQKAADGKPTSLFVPDRNAFASEFAGAVGDLYRGRPGAQEVDLQSAMAYYVGKAAQTGAVLSDPKSADSKLVREAITATVGKPVNFQSNGYVTLPIGMAQGTFEQKIVQAYAEEVKTRGLPPQALDAFANYGLQNYRADGSYVMTLGGVPVVDPQTRRPIVLDITSLAGFPRYRQGGASMVPTR